MSLFQKFRAPESEDQGEFYKEGDDFGDYRIVRMLSYSIIGCLYQVEEEISSRKQILMIFPSRASADPRFGDRFRSLTERVKKLSHPNLLKLQDGVIIRRRYVWIYEADEDDIITLEQYPDELEAGKVPMSAHPFTLEGQRLKDAGVVGSRPAPAETTAGETAHRAMRRKAAEPAARPAMPAKKKGRQQRRAFHS